MKIRLESLMSKFAFFPHLHGFESINKLMEFVKRNIIRKEK